VTQKFGWETRQHIERMTRHKLRRKILEEWETGARAVDPGGAAQPAA
jgi:hypothetical protein